MKLHWSKAKGSVMGNKGLLLMGNLCLNNSSSQLKQGTRLNRKVKNNRSHEDEVQDSVRSTCPIDWTTLQG
jgi:hypothetical protein